MKASKELIFYSNFSYDPSMRKVFESTILSIVNGTPAENVIELIEMLKTLTPPEKGSKGFLERVIRQLDEISLTIKTQTVITP